MSGAFGRSLFLTGKGKLGLCSVRARPGDSVVILAGCSVPVILSIDADICTSSGAPGPIEEDSDSSSAASRPSTENSEASEGDTGSSFSQSDCWKFVGEAHVNGMMDGEMFKEIMNLNESMETFTLI